MPTASASRYAVLGSPSRSPNPSRSKSAATRKPTAKRLPTAMPTTTVSTLAAATAALSDPFSVVARACSLHWRPLMAVPKRKTSKSRRDKRRAQHAISAPRVSTCEQCGSPKRSHHVCPTCKTYRGREISPLRAPAP